MLTIQKQRQGVANHVRAWFLPCPHGESYHWEWQSWRDKDNGQAEICYPNCAECHGQHRGQVAWSLNSIWHKDHFQRRPDTTKFKTETLAAAEKLSAAAILRLTGVEVEFSKNVEAYCYNTENEMRIWPHIASDVYVAAAVYERPTDTIRHVPSNVCLIRWVDGKPDFDLDAAAKPYRAECESEYIKELHNE
jgi:hypothetical protein